MIREAREADIAAVNAIRRQVNDLHVNGRPDIFKPGFGPEIRDHILEYLRREDWRLLVCERAGAVCAFAALEYVSRPENAYNLARSYVHITEFGVDASCRRAGAGRALFEYIKADAKEKGFPSVELDVWAFNGDALRFYEAMGMRCFRRMMAVPTDE